MKRPTLADIASRAGVTKAAVSFALNGQPGVSAATRARPGHSADGSAVGNFEEAPPVLIRRGSTGRPARPARLRGTTSPSVPV